MDIAVELVEAYLRLNGYLTLSEFEVQRRGSDGLYETITDVDVVGLRFPGDVYAGDPHEGPECRLLLIQDDALLLEEDTIDVILGEVKQGDAVFNPGLRRHEVLHSVLRRVEWIYRDPVEAIVEDLQQHSVSNRESCGGSAVRTRLVAFGRSAGNDLHTLSLTHIFETMVAFMEDFDEVLRPAQLKDPASALLRLLVKVGFSVRKEE